MHKGYGSRVCVSVTALTATYLVYKSQIRCYKVPWGVLNVHIVWKALKTLVLQFWRHLLKTAAFHALWRDLDEEDEQQWALSRYKVCAFSDSSYKTTADKSSAKYELKLLDFSRSPSLVNVSCAMWGLRHYDGSINPYFHVSSMVHCALLQGPDLSQGG